MEDLTVKKIEQMINTLKRKQDRSIQAFKEIYQKKILELEQLKKQLESI